MLKHFKHCLLIDVITKQVLPCVVIFIYILDAKLHVYFKCNLTILEKQKIIGCGIIENVAYFT